MTIIDFLTAHITAFVLGFFLDLLLGDPHFMLHPVQLMGLLISTLTKKLHPADKERKPGRELRRGILCALIVIFFSIAVPAILLFAGYRIHILAGIVIETIMTYQILAIKSMKTESMKVYRALDTSLEDGRKAVSMIVGRDTQCLDEEGVIKATVETVAENTSDGVIAPMLYTALGGPILGFWYKGINTMDSMIGYKNDVYLYYGRFAAKLDDVVNYLPSRISAGLMILATAFCGREYSFKDAIRIHRRDRRNHASPNSAQTESVCAGALGLRLAGDASYFGKVVKKPYIGDAKRSPERNDIKKVCKLMTVTSFLGEMICLILLIGLWMVLIWLKI